MTDEAMSPLRRRMIEDMMSTRAPSSSYRPSSVISITQARSTRVASARCDRGVTDITDPLPAACEASNVSAGSADGGLNITRVGEGQ